MRRARVDANQREIVDALKRAGASVQHLHAVGEGCPDILVGHLGRNYLLEIKDGDKPPSARRLTKPQERWHTQWSGQATVVKDSLEALRACGIVLVRVEDV